MAGASRRQAARRHFQNGVAFESLCWYYVSRFRCRFKEPPENHEKTLKKIGMKKFGDPFLIRYNRPKRLLLYIATKRGGQKKKNQRAKKKVAIKNWKWIFFMRNYFHFASAFLLWKGIQRRNTDDCADPLSTNVKKFRKTPSLFIYIYINLYFCFLFFFLCIMHG